MCVLECLGVFPHTRKKNQLMTASFCDQTTGGLLFKKPQRAASQVISSAFGLCSMSKSLFFFSFSFSKEYNGVYICMDHVYRRSTIGPDRYR